MHEHQLCPVCLKNGRKSFLKSFQVNLEEALWLCEFKRCIYPLGQNSDLTFNRKVEDLSTEKDKPTRVPSAQLALQLQVAGRLNECHQKIQKDVIGIQTGSPLLTKKFSKRKELKQNGHATSFNPSSKSFNPNGAKHYSESFNPPSLYKNGTDKKAEVFPGYAIGQTTVTNGTVTNNKTDYFGNRSLQGESASLKFDCDRIKTGDKGSDHVRSDEKILLGNRDSGSQGSTSLRKIEAVRKDRNSPFSGENGKLKRNPFLQWKNRDALCWLDVVLCLLIHNRTLNKLIDSEEMSIKTSQIYKVLNNYRQASCIKSKHKVYSEAFINGNGSIFKTRRNAHQNGHKDFPECLQVLPNNIESHLDPGDILDEIRSEVWRSVQEKIKCEKGKHSSPVLAIPALLEGNAVIDSLFRSRYRFKYNCPRCQFIEDTDCESVLPSLPALVKDFKIRNPIHKKKCLNCSYTKGQREMVYEKLPKSFMMHFIEGLPNSSWSSLEFVTRDDTQYTVTGVVQYLRNPDHFVAWLRNPEDNTWIECDDLKSPLCPVTDTPPTFPWKQIHIIMWEQVERRPKNGLSDSVKDHMSDFKVGIGNSANICGQNGYEGRPNGNFTLSSGKNVLSSTSDMCSSVPKLSQCKTVLDLNKPSYGLLGSKQISIDSQRFLNSCTTSLSSSVERSECSSISSTCSELSDNVSLPEFTATTQLEHNLVKPVACRTDGSAQNLEVDDRNRHETDPNCVNSHQKAFNLDFNHSVQSKCSPQKLCHVQQEIMKTQNLQGNKVIPNIKPSSVFCALKKDVEFVKEQSDENSKVKSTCSVEHKIASEINEKLDENKLKTISTIKSEPTEAALKVNNIVNSVKTEVSSNNTKDTLPTRFKLPALLLPKRKTCKISRDAFQTLSKTSTTSVPTPVARTPNLSPANIRLAPHLTAVKQYLIDKTTDSMQSKTRFEGLSLKSAPNLIKPSLDLPVFRRSDSDPSLKSSPKPSMEASPSSTFISNKRDNLAQSDTNGKRKRSQSKEPLAKRVKSQLNKVLNISPQTTSKLSTVGSASSQSAHQETFKPENSEKVKGHTIANISCESELINDFTSADRNMTLKYTKPERIKKENGILTQNSNKILKNDESEADSILQDLYDALNIPFTSVKDTMLDVMGDVNDILGTLDTTDLTLFQPCKTDNLHTGLGNQTPLDCGQSEMHLLDQSSRVARQQFWSANMRLDKILLLS